MDYGSLAAKPSVNTEAIIQLKFGLSLSVNG